MAATLPAVEPRRAVEIEMRGLLTATDESAPPPRAAALRGRAASAAVAAASAEAAGVVRGDEPLARVAAAAAVVDATAGEVEEEKSEGVNDEDSAILAICGLAHALPHECLRLVFAFV